MASFEEHKKIIDNWQLNFILQSPNILGERGANKNHNLIIRQYAIKKSYYNYVDYFKLKRVQAKH